MTTESSPAGSGDSSLFTAQAHEIGTRLVDMLNQTGFLYRFPAFAGVTLACISQHIEPMTRLLRSCEQARLKLGMEKSAGGYSVGPINGPDPLGAAFEYACLGMRTFMQSLAHLSRQSHDAGEAGTQDELAAFIGTCGDQAAPDPKGILRLKDTIETYSEAAAKVASGSFQPMTEIEWQEFRMVIFYFLLDLQKAGTTGSP